MTQLGEFNWLQYDPNSFLDRVRVTFRLMASRERVTPSPAHARCPRKKALKKARRHTRLCEVTRASERETGSATSKRDGASAH